MAHDSDWPVRMTTESLREIAALHRSVKPACINAQHVRTILRKERIEPHRRTSLRTMSSR